MVLATGRDLVRRRRRAIWWVAVAGVTVQPRPSAAGFAEVAPREPNATAQEPEGERTRPPIDAPQWPARHCSRWITGASAGAPMPVETITPERWSSTQTEANGPEGAGARARPTSRLQPQVQPPFSLTPAAVV